MALYDPAGMSTAGKIPVYILPALASTDLSAVTVAEMGAGTQVDTAMTSLSSTSEQATRERKMLSDTVAEQIGGQITRSLDMGTMAAMDPQATDALKTLLVEGDELFVVALPGLASSTAPAAAQKAWIWKATVGTVDPAEITSEDGNEFGWNVTWTKVTRNLDAAVSGV